MSKHFEPPLGVKFVPFSRASSRFSEGQTKSSPLPTALLMLSFPSICIPPTCVSFPSPSYPSRHPYSQPPAPSTTLSVAVLSVHAVGGTENRRLESRWVGRRIASSRWGNSGRIWGVIWGLQGLESSLSSGGDNAIEDSHCLQGNWSLLCGDALGFWETSSMPYGVAGHPSQGKSAAACPAGSPET